MYFKIKKLKKRQIKKSLVLEVINDLFNFGSQYNGIDRNYVLKEIGKNIWKLKLYFKVPLDINIKRFLCRKCNVILIPGYNLRVRNYKECMEYKCLNCGFTRRYKIKN
ncbi:MAG: hypothetical protein QXD62_02130 [Candidatus Woesearchaeota archaeon]